MSRHLSVEQKLIRARTQLLLNHPFFGTLSVRLKLEPGPVPTMATKRPPDRLQPGICRGAETGGARRRAGARGPTLRAGASVPARPKRPDLWNQAADYAINPILLAGGVALPAGVLVDPAFADLSAEEIYSQLIKNRESGGAVDSANKKAEAGPGASGPAATAGSTENQQQTQTPCPGAVGEVMDAVGEDGKTASQAERQRQERVWRIMAEQAIRSAKACGHEPAGIKRTLNEARRRCVDWRSALRDFILASRPSDYSWTHPNLRHLGRGRYLPSVVRSGVGEIIIVVDTSGSIAAEELDQFAAEITAIAEEVQPGGIHVVYCDASVQSTQEFAPPESVVLSPKGSGGTDFRPPFDWVEKQGLAPACLIYLTDLCCRSYPEPPGYPVLWATDSRRTAAFGETLRIEADG